MFKKQLEFDVNVHGKERGEYQYMTDYEKRKISVVKCVEKHPSTIEGCRDKSM